MRVLSWNNLGFEYIRDVRVISLDAIENAIVPMGALENIPRRK